MSKPEPFAQYRGVNYLELVDEVQRRGLCAWQEVLRISCGPTVDGEHYFNPRECTGIVNYFVADHARFDYRREWPVSPADELRIKELLEQRQGARRELGMVLGH